ncbi:HEXXH motif-containing putative peptide modification protein [Actinoplanes sp. NPDC051851]|uniref:aKG-HExxH-type peptide beta-hydroxylase n=1 Tax=Actinoplanes sp. NPDC051851 TaxID=3154753 RepID=UPI003413D886
MTPEVLADLGGGASAPATIGFLRSGQLAKHLHLLLALLRECTGARREAADRALAVLGEAQRARPDVTEDLLSAPLTGAWLASAVRHRAAEPDTLGRLAALAVVAGARAGLSGEFVVPARHGAVHLPGHGSVAGVPGDGVRVAYAGGRLELDGHVALPARTIVLGGPCVVAVEDTDAYRDCYHVPATPRLDDAAFARWSAVLTEAWGLLADRAPGYAAELTAGLRAVVPLRVEPGSPDVSATSRIAFGAVALSAPRRPDHAAAALVHEFQHSKLSALLDLIALHSGDPECRYFAPWRRDKRPIGGMLQGAYAFLAVADLWRRLGTDIATLDASERSFADLYVQLGEVLATLRDAPAFNDAGRRMVGSLDDRFHGWLDGTVPVSSMIPAQQRLERHRRLWTDFNHV